jgi:hypothetical protein
MRLTVGSRLKLNEGDMLRYVEANSAYINKLIDKCAAMYGDDIEVPEAGANPAPTA